MTSANKLILDYTGLELLRGIQFATEIARNRCNKNGIPCTLTVEDLALSFKQLSSLNVPVYGDRMKAFATDTPIPPPSGAVGSKVGSKPSSIPQFKDAIRGAYRHPSHAKRLALIKKCEAKCDREKKLSEIAQERLQIKLTAMAERSPIAVAAAERRKLQKRLKLNQ